MKKLLMIFAGAALFSFQACQGDTSDGKVNTNENTQETSQSVMDAGNEGSNASSDTDSSNARMEEHTRMNQAAEEAEPKR
ncbi:hypothetical protein I5M27_13945 [Adhaeribacter sp. BT258]|uniref:Uncharacterized protein n=1 Tax=Adhaeribacter terrigena TaxID=2793070 RepID=A0ABS1C449_9BACT|nr:hypothetical protein [Adhaeribacter terrigena]MBK0404093.1 hypothetical protein [Adhaeribacter terrigena]